MPCREPARIRTNFDGLRAEGLTGASGTPSSQGRDVALKVLRPDSAQLSDPDRWNDTSGDQIEHVRPADAEAVCGLFHGEKEALPHTLLGG